MKTLQRDEHNEIIKPSCLVPPTQPTTGSVCDGILQQRDKHD